MKGIALAGTILVDKINNIKAYPSIGELTQISSVEKAVGGLVPNVAIDLKRLDETVDIYAVGRVGRDEEGEFVLKKLKENGVDTENVIYGEQKTSFTEVMSVKGGQRTFFTYAGESAEFGFKDINFDKLNIKMLHLGYFLLLDKIDNGDGIKILKEAKQRGITTSIDLVSENSDRYHLVKPCLEYTDNLIINEIEGSKLSGVSIDNIQQICVKLKEMGVKERVIIHKAEKSAVYDGNTYLEMPAIDVPKSFIKGKTGAGDAFCAGCIMGIYYGMNNIEILDLASRCAIANLSEVNSIDGMKSKKQVYELTEKFIKV